VTVVNRQLRKAVIARVCRRFHYQTLMDLMLNGIEAIPAVGGMVTVKSQLGEDGQIEISVNDTGRVQHGEKRPNPG
jgi:hypothetical protein